MTPQRRSTPSVWYCLAWACTWLALAFWFAVSDGKPELRAAALVIINVWLAAAHLAQSRDTP